MNEIRKRQRFLSCFLAFCLIITAIIPSTITTAYAATTYKVTCTDSGLNYGAGSQSTFERGDGTVVYCGEHDVYSPVDKGDSASLSFSAYTKSKMLIKALYYGKGGPKEWSGFGSYTAKQAKCITALAISNAYIDSGDAKSAAVKVDVDDVKGLKAFWDFIKEKTVPAADRFEVYRYAGDAWTQSLFTFEYYPKGDGTLVKESNNSNTSSTNGYYLKDAKYGVYKTKSNAENNKNKVGTLTTVAGGTANTLTLDVGTYYVKETAAPLGFALDDTIYTMEIKEDKTTTLKVKDQALKGSLQIIKKSSNSNTVGNEHYSLKGAEFKVYRDKDKQNFVTTLTTDQNGKTSEFSCIADTYYIYETKAPKGFKPYDGVITAKVTIGQKTEKTVSEDPIRGQLQIKKISTNSNTEDNPNYSLEGAKFSIYRDKAKKNLVTTLTTDKNGLTGKYTCIADTYYVYEDTAPKGFQRIEGLVGTFDTGESFLELGQDYLFEVKENPVRGRIQIVKKSTVEEVNGNKNYSLEGAKFSVYRDKEKKEKVTTLTTDASGKTESFTCVADTYYVYEDKAPKGFQAIEGLVGTMNTGKAFLELEQDYVLTIKNDPIPGQIQIVKKPEHPELIQGNGNYTLEGAVFGVYRDQDCQDLLTQLTTDGAGETKPFSVYANTYYIKELKAPKGFMLNENIFSASVTVGQMKTVMIDEKEETGFAKVKKVIAGGSVNEALVSLCPKYYTLEGAVYGIYRTKSDASANKSAITTLTTTKKGDSPAVELPLGDYYVKEITPSKGYVLDEEIYKVTVTAKQTATVTSSEVPLFLPGALMLKKVSETDPKLSLAGAEFTIRYYGELTEKVNGLTPLREWKFITNVKGEITLSEEDYTGGDPLFKDDDGQVVGLIGTYEIIESKAPDGYLLNPVPVIRQMKQVDDYIQLLEQTPVIPNTPQKVKLTLQKVDRETGLRVPQKLGSFAGAIYEVFSVNAEGLADILVDTLTTDHKGEAISKMLPLGKYLVREKKAPAGYTVNPDFVPVEAKATDDTTKIFNYIVHSEEQPTTTEVNKLESSTEQFVKGAVLAIFDEQGQEIERWTTGEEPHRFKALPVGEYTLKELSVPAGYVRAKEVQFTVKETGDVQQVVMEDDYIKVAILKIDAASGNPLAGVQLELLDEEGKVVDSWTTTEEPHTMDKLPAGNYVLHEVKPLDGYLPAEDKAFVVEETAEVQKIVMENDYTKIDISKTDITTGTPVIGAKLEIWDEAGNLVDRWTSSEASHRIEKLMPGKYKLMESYAPGSYVTAKAIEFVVEPTGKIQKIVMEDDYTKVEISKIDIVTGEPVIGAKLEILDASGKLIEKWTTEEQPHLIERLAKGEYTLVETYAPGSYVMAERVTFTVEDTREIQKVVMKDDHTKVEISKTDIVTGEPVVGAKLEILDASGNLIEKWTTGEHPHFIECLSKGRYTLVETYAPGSYVTAKSVAFTVEDTGEIQKVEMKDDFTKLELHKIDAETGESVAKTGFALIPVDEEGNPTEEPYMTDLTDETGVVRLERIPVGTYILREVIVNAAAGYIPAEDMAIEVKDTEEVQIFTMEDDYTKVEFYKLDQETGKPVVGTRLTIIPVDEEGQPQWNQVYSTWETKEEAHTETYMPAGDYVLTEQLGGKAFDAGYVTAKCIPFTVAVTGTVQKVEMLDDHTKITIAKTDLSTGKNLAGAVLQIVDYTGKVVREWMTKDTPSVITRLPIGEYTLVEKTPPAGYVTADPMTFRIEDTGEMHHVEMKDDFTKVEIYKVEAGTDIPVKGAELAVMDEDEKPILSFKTSNKPYYVEKLPVGDYILKEISAPEGYVEAEDIRFTVADAGQIQKVVMEDESIEMEKAPVPETGDETKGMIWSMLLISSIVLLLLTVYRIKE